MFAATWLPCISFFEGQHSQDFQVPKASSAGSALGAGKETVNKIQTIRIRADLPLYPSTEAAEEGNPNAFLPNVRHLHNFFAFSIS